MGKKTQIAFILGFALLLFGSVGAWAYDQSRSDVIAEGITIGGVDVGGLEDDEAEQRLRRNLVQPLRKPIRVVYQGERWTLPAAELRIRSDIEAAVDRALEESTEGGLPGRLARYLSGDTIEREFTPSIAYSRPAINRFVREVAAAINRPAQDAGVDASGDSLTIARAKPGLELRDNWLTDELERAVLQPASTRTIAARVRRTAPAVTTAEVADEYPVFITIDRDDFELRLWKKLRLAETYTVAIGAAGYDTPSGLYEATDMAVDPDWHVPDAEWAGDLAGTIVPGGTAENPLKARWIGFYDGAGIHGTAEVDSLGTAASHGCIRMAVSDVIELYEQVDIGTPIYIE